MVIPLGPGKKRPIQKGRNFVFNKIQQTYFDRLLRQEQRKQFAARAKRTKSKAKEIAKHILEEMYLDMQSQQGKNRAAISKKTRTRVNKILVSKMPLTKDQKKFVSTVLERDIELDQLKHNLEIGKKFTIKQVLNVFRQTLMDYKSLGSYGQRRFPNELAEALEFAVTQENKISELHISPAFFSIAKQINMAKLDKQFGKGISLFMSETLAEISRQMNKNS